MKREITHKLIDWSKRKDKKPLILMGARQIGKTYSLLELAEQQYENHTYINFEKRPELKEIFDINLDPTRIIKDLETALKTSINIEKDLLILDEIQVCPKAITSLKYFCEEMNQLSICCAGSLLGVKHGEESFPVGKVEFLNMFPLTFFEFLNATGEQQNLKYIQNWDGETKIPEVIHKNLWDLWRIYLIIGGLPEVILAYKEKLEDSITALRFAREKQDNLIRTYQADIAKYSGKQNSMHVERIWSNIPNQLAKELDGTAPKYKFGGVIPKVKGYSRMSGPMDWLENAGLVLKIPIVNSGEAPLQAYASENVFKLFLFDVGILGALSGIEPETILSYQYGTYKGFYAENFVAQEFAFAMGRVDKLFAWKKGKSEVEFIREIKGERIPIEVKSGSNTKAKSIQIFMEKYKSPYRVILSGNNFGIDQEKHVHRYPIYTASLFPIKG